MPQSNDFNATSLSQAKEPYKTGRFGDNQVAYNRVISLSVESGDAIAPLGSSFACLRSFAIVLLAVFLLGSFRSAAADEPRTAPYPVSCVVLGDCPAPNVAPYVMLVNALPNGSINLSAPLDVDPTYPDSAENTQGGWATGVIQHNTNQTPSQAEVLRLSSPLDLLAGEALADAHFPYPSLPIRISTSSMVFQVPISFTGTSVFYTSGNICLPPPSNQAYCSGNNGFQGGDGQYAVYMARVEDCISSADHPPSTLNAVTGPDGSNLQCSTADGIPGNLGTWYDIAPAWSATGILGPAPSPTKTASGTLNVPAQLPVPVNSLRIEFAVGLVDNPGGVFIDSFSWFVSLPSDPQGYEEWGCCDRALTRFAVDFAPVTVLPAAFIQLKVLPYTIVYRPPGDQSFGTFTTTKSYGTSMSVGNNTTIDNSNTFLQSSGGTFTNGSTLSATVTSFVASLGLTQTDTSTLMNSNIWDANTVAGVGLTVANSNTEAFTHQVGSSASDPTIFPASDYVVPNTCGPSNYSASCSVMPAESYNQEPFWADLFILTLHPQAAVWDFNGTPGIQLLGADASTDQVSVTDLDGCAQNSDPQAWPLANGDFLSPSECQQLLALDPFYGTGQSYDPSVSGRGLPLGSSGYGRDPRKPSSDTSAAIGNIFTYSVAQSTNTTASYNATLQAVVGLSWSNGLTLGPSSGIQTPIAGMGSPSVGASGAANSAITVTHGIQQTSNTSMKITYTSSTVATTTSSTTLGGTLNDDHDFYTPACQQNTHFCYHPFATIFLDELFGGYMFQDASAARACRFGLCQSMVVMSAALSSTTPNKKGSGKNDRPVRIPLPALESAAVISLRTMYQSLYAYAQAHPAQGYPTSLREADLTLAGAEKDGSKFVYVPKAPGPNGKIAAYQISSEPLRPTKSVSRQFFMDETGVIRVSQKGPADVKSPALR